MPRYVSDNPELLPQFLVEKGDIMIISNKIEKLEEEMYSMRSEDQALRCDIGLCPPLSRILVNMHLSFLS